MCANRSVLQEVGVIGWSVLSVAPKDWERNHHWNTFSQATLLISDLLHFASLSLSDSSKACKLKQDRNTVDVKYSHSIIDYYVGLFPFVLVSICFYWAQRAVLDTTGM